MLDVFILDTKQKPISYATNINNFISDKKKIYEQKMEDYKEMI